MGQPMRHPLGVFPSTIALLLYAGLPLVGANIVSAQNLPTEDLSGIHFSSTSIVHANWVSFGHDSSSLNSLLGNPTSVLSLGPLVFGTQAFSASLTNELGGTFTAGLSIGHSLSSTLRDDDFFVGQTLMHQTFSIIQPAIQYGIQLSAKSRNLGDPFGSGWEVRGLAKLDASMMTFISTGLTCGQVCKGIPNIASTTPVLTHEFKSHSIMGGIEATHILDTSSRLGVDLALGPSWNEIKDTHHLRADLGSSPHIIYTLFGPRMDMGLFHQTELNTNLTLTFGLKGRASWEFGIVQFAPATPNPLSPLPSFAQKHTMSASYQLNGKF